MEQSLRKNVLGVVRHVIFDAVRVEALGGKQYQISLKLSEDELKSLLVFMVSKGFSADEAIQEIRQMQQTAVQNVRESLAKGNMPKDSGSGAGWLWLVPVGIMLLWGALALTEVIPLWTLLLIIPFGFFLMWLFWNPKGSAIHKVWKSFGEDGLTAKLEKMLEIQQTPTVSYLLKNARVPFIAMTAAFVLSFGGVAAVTVGGMVGNARYHAAMTRDGDLFSMRGSTGTRYALYDADAERFIVEPYLSGDLRAETASDVRGVLMLNAGELKVGTYSSGGSAYQRRVTITLYDCSSGEEVARTSVYGDDPPKKIVRRGVSILFSKDAYGSKPSDQDIERACRRLISEFESSHNESK